MQEGSGYPAALSAQHRRPYVDHVCFTNYTDQRGCKSVDKVMSGSQRSSRSSSSSISSSHTMGPFICRVPHCHTSTWGGELVRADIRHFVVALAISGFGTYLSFVLCLVLALRLLSQKLQGILGACGKLSKSWNFNLAALISALMQLNEAWN